MNKLRQAAERLVAITLDLENDWVGQEWPELMNAVRELRAALACDHSETHVCRLTEDGAEMRCLRCGEEWAT